MKKNQLSRESESKDSSVQFPIMLFFKLKFELEWNLNVLLRSTT